MNPILSMMQGETEASPSAPPASQEAQAGASAAKPMPAFSLPPVEQMVSDYQRWQMMASDPAVAALVKPRMDAWKNLAMQQHAKAFQGDPTSSPLQAAAYARHMGQLSGQMGTPMSPEEARRIAEYVDGAKAKMPQNFMDGMNRYDAGLVQPLVDDVFGKDWQMASLKPGAMQVGGASMEVPTLTVRNRHTGEQKSYTSTDVSAIFGNLEGKLRYAKENRDQAMKAAMADLELAKARQDPQAAYQAWQRAQELQGGTGGFGGGSPAGAGAMAYLPKVQEALQATQSPLDPLFVISIMNAESGGNAKATSPKNAQGLMQLIPDTAKRFGVQDAYDPDQAIAGGVKYLNWLHNRFGGDLTKVAAAYNAGEGAVDKYGGVPPYAETQNYVRKVLGTMNTHRAKPGDSPEAIGQRLVGMAPAGGANAPEVVGSIQNPALAKHEALVNKMYEKAAGDAAKMDVIAAFDQRERVRIAGSGGGPSAAGEIGLGSDWETPSSPSGVGSLPMPGRRGVAARDTQEAMPKPETGQEALKAQSDAIRHEQQTKKDRTQNEALWKEVQARGGKYEPGIFSGIPENMTAEQWGQGPSVAQAKEDLAFLVEQWPHLQPKQQQQVKQYMRTLVTQYPELRPSS